MCLKTCRWCLTLKRVLSFLVDAVTPESSIHLSTQEIRSGEPLHTQSSAGFTFSTSTTKNSIGPQINCVSWAFVISSGLTAPELKQCTGFDNGRGSIANHALSA